jgi:hypothetical protein
VTTDPPFISYASPPRPWADETYPFRIELRPPPPWLDIVVLSAAIMLILVGVEACIGMAIDNWLDPEYSFRLTEYLVPLMGVLVLGLAARSVVRKLRRLHKFWRVPITLAVRAGELVIDDPTRRNHPLRTWNSDEIDRIRVCLVGWTVLRERLCALLVIPRHRQFKKSEEIRFIWNDEIPVESLETGIKEHLYQPNVTTDSH